MNKVDFNAFVPKFTEICDRGLSMGLGKRDGQMCIEAAVCAALDLPHSDDPGCVAKAVRSFKIALNDSNWSSPEARAKGLYKLGIAQIGSLGVVDDTQFSKRLAELTIRQLIPKLFRALFSGNNTLIAAALRCEQEGTAYAAADAARAAADAARAAAARAAYAAAYAADAARAAAAYAAAYAADAARAAYAAAYAADAARAAAYAIDKDYFLVLSADLALQVLTEFKSPGVAFIPKG